MSTPTKPLVGMAPAIYWTAGGNTFEVDDPVFYAWLSASLGSRSIYAYDFDPYQYDFNRSTGDVTFRMFSTPPTILDPRRPLVIDRPVYLYVVDPTDPHLLRTDEFSPQQEGMSLYYKDGLTWAGMILKPDGTASPAWQQKDDHSVTFGELLTAAVVIWGGAFAVGAIAGAEVGTAITVADTASATGATSTAAGGGELIASDFVGSITPVAESTGQAVAASATAGTTAATTGSAAFSMSDVMGASKAVVAVAGAASKIEQAISGATVSQVLPAPESAPPKPPDNSWLALLGVAIILVFPP